MLAKLCVLLAVVASVSAVYFDCRRIGQICMNSGICGDKTGNCTCDPANSGYNCGITTANIDAAGATCTPACERGTCASATCHCPEEYYGPTCSERRAQATCTGDSLNIVIVPYDGFLGMVLVRENRSDAACTFTMTESAGLKTYSANLTFVGGCSITESSPTPDAKKYSADVLIQNSPIFETALDILIDASCTLSTTGQAGVNGGLGAVAVDERGNLTEDSTSTVYEPVVLEVQKADGTKIVPPLYLGSPLRLYFPLADVQKFKNIAVNNCTAISGSVSSPVTALIVDNKCPTDAGKAILTSAITQSLTPTPSVSIYFNAFRFPMSTTVSFQCSLILCETVDDPKCIQPSCDGSSVARKKRSAADTLIQSEEEFTVQGEVTVLDIHDPIILPETSVKGDNQAQERQPESRLDAEKCLLSNEILAVVIVLVIAVVFLLVVTLCFAIRFMKSRTHGKCMDTPLPMAGDTRLPRPNF